MQRPAPTRRVLVMAGALVLLAGLAAWWAVGHHDAGEGSGALVASPRAPAEVPLLLGATAAPEPEPLVASPGAGVVPPSALAPAALELEVVDVAGAPVHGALVAISGVFGTASTTDAAGRVRLPVEALAHGAPADAAITVTALCYRVATVPVVVPPSGALRVVLRRCPTLYVVLAPAPDLDMTRLCLSLRSEAALFDAGLPVVMTGGIGARRGDIFSRFPLSGPESREPHTTIGRRDTRDSELFEDGDPDDWRLYDFARDGTRLVVGLQAGQPVRVAVGGAYGERLFESVVTLAEEEWRELHVRVDPPARDVVVRVRTPYGHAIEGPRVCLSLERPVTSTMATIATSARATPGVVTFPGLRAACVSLLVAADGFVPQEIRDAPLTADGLVDVVMQRSP
jgi:hypothetical protein